MNREAQMAPEHQLRQNGLNSAASHTGLLAARSISYSCRSDDVDLSLSDRPLFGRPREIYYWLQADDS